MSQTLSHEDRLIELKQKLDANGLDRNNPSSFSSCSQDVREQATNLIFTYLAEYNDCAIGLLYKDLLNLDKHSDLKRPLAHGKQSTLESFFSKRPKVTPLNPQEGDFFSTSVATVYPYSFRLSGRGRARSH